MANLNTVLSNEFTSKDDLFELIAFLKKDFNKELIDENFGPNIAREYARVIHKKRAELKDNQKANLFKSLANLLYRENKSKIDLIKSENALKDVGMVDHDSVGPLMYESPY